MPEQSHGRKSFDWIPAGSLGLALVAALIVILKGGDPMDHLKIIAGYTILILVFFYGLLVLIAMARGKIDLKFLVSESDTGHASMARFQLLIFTFVIALSFFLILVGNKNKLEFPAVPKEVLMLLGISATTYAAGKAIQLSSGGGTPSNGSTDQDGGAAGQGKNPPPDK